MSEKRIIFCQDLIPKVLDGTKRVTRRCHTKLKYQPGDVIYLAENYWHPYYLSEPEYQGQRFGKPSYSGGGPIKIVPELEEWAKQCNYPWPPTFYYCATDEQPTGDDMITYEKVSSRYTPKWATRPWRGLITEAEFVQLQDITVEEIIMEGLSSHLRGHDACCDLKEQWVSLWDRLNGKRKGLAWENNPRVARYAWEPIT
jgi:hypothetical protein